VGALAEGWAHPRGASRFVRLLLLAKLDVRALLPDEKNFSFGFSFLATVSSDLLDGVVPLSALSVTMAHRSRRLRH